MFQSENVVLIFWVVITLPTSEIGLNVPVRFVYCLKTDKTLMCYLFFWRIILVYFSVLIYPSSRRILRDFNYQIFYNTFVSAVGKQTEFSEAMQVSSVDEPPVL